MPREFSVVAIIAAYNEADIIGAVVARSDRAGHRHLLSGRRLDRRHGARPSSLTADRGVHSDRAPARHDASARDDVRLGTHPAQEGPTRHRARRRLVHPPRRRRVPREPVGGCPAQGSHQTRRCDGLQRHRLRESRFSSDRRCVSRRRRTPRVRFLFRGSAVRQGSDPLLEEDQRRRPGVDWRPRSPIREPQRLSDSVSPSTLPRSRASARRPQGVRRSAAPVRRARNAPAAGMCSTTTSSKGRRSSTIHVR